MDMSFTPVKMFINWFYPTPAGGWLDEPCSIFWWAFNASVLSKTLPQILQRRCFGDLVLDEVAVAIAYTIIMETTHN